MLVSIVLCTRGFCVWIPETKLLKHKAIKTIDVRIEETVKNEKVSDQSFFHLDVLDLDDLEVSDTEKLCVESNKQRDSQTLLQY